MQARLLFGEGDVQPPQPNAAGGFDAYRPTTALPAYSALVVQLDSVAVDRYLIRVCVGRIQASEK